MRLILITALIMLAPASVAETVHKWVDDQGVTHYSSDEPENRSSSEKRVHNAPSSSQGEALERLNGQETGSTGDAESTGEQDQQADGASKMTPEDCRMFRKNLEALKKPTVRRENSETGEKEVLDKEQRQSVREHSRKGLELCNKQGVSAAGSSGQ